MPEQFGNKWYCVVSYANQNIIIFFLLLWISWQEMRKAQC